MLDRVFTELFYWKEVAALLNFFLNDSRKKKILGTSVSESLFQQDQEKNSQAVQAKQNWSLIISIWATTLSAFKKTPTVLQ